MRGERPIKKRDHQSEADWRTLARATLRLWRMVVRVREGGAQWRLGAALVLTLASKITAVFAPLALGAGVNALAEGDRAGASWAFGGAVLAWTGLRLAGNLAPILRDALFAPVSEAAQRLFAVEGFAHAQHLSLRFHLAKRTGALQRVIERGARAIDFLLRILAFSLAPTLVELALASAVMAAVFGPGFAAIAAATVVIYVASTFAITEWRAQFRRDMNAKDSEVSARAVDSLMNVETVKSFAAEAREAARYEDALRDYGAAAAKSVSSLAVLNGVQAVLQAAGLLGVVWLAGLAILEGRMGPGDVAAVILIMINLYAPMNILGFAYREVKQSAIDMEKLFDLLNEAPDIADRPGAVDLPAQRGEIAFEGVFFRHDERLAGLENIDFTLASGRKLALVGPSGAGKSTIIRLLMRFYDPQSGRILIDGTDIAAVTQVSLRRVIGFVPQDVVLFNDTLRRNIAYGDFGADQERLDRAAERAQLSDFIAGLPQGWDTLVGERGLRLSGGERQRVGIARALLIDPLILVFDEATSSLDSRTEASVQAAIAAASAGRTTIVVAHRLSTIRDADAILVLDQGRIVERGDHASLLAAQGLYAQLWEAQQHHEGDDDARPPRANPAGYQTLRG